MSILSSAKGLYTWIKYAVLGIAKVKKLKIFNKATVILGATQQILFSIIQSANSGNPTIWFREIALVLFRADYKILQHINEIQSGVSNIEFISLTLGIYAQLWIIASIAKFFRYTAKKSFAGTDVSKWSMSLWIYFLPVALLLWSGGVAHMAITKGDAFTASTLVSKEVIPFYSIFKLITNIDIWITPLEGILQPLQEMLGQNVDKNQGNWTRIGLNSTK